MASKFEKLIEYVVANDEASAKALLHKIVVEKSRRIYEAMDVEDAADSVQADHTNLDPAAEEFGGDQADDLETDTFASTDGDEFGKEESETINPDVDERIGDLEAELDSFKAEFEELLKSIEEDEPMSSEPSQEEGEDEIDSEIEDIDFDDKGESKDEDSFEEEDESKDEDNFEEEGEEKEEKEEPVDEDMIREYVEKVTKGLATDKEDSEVQSKTSPVAKKNDMGGTAKNIAQSATEKGRSAPKSGEMTSDKVANRPGADSGVKSLKSVKPGTTTKEAPKTNTKSIES